MGKVTGIEWTQHTWNPWQGCTKVSPGCAHCYMFRDKHRYGQDPETVVRSRPATFNKPLSWKDPALVFTCSWSDWFHEAADAWRADAWDIVRRTPHLTYQILTKRPDRIAAHLPPDWGDGWPNVWLGTSVENARWTHRVQQLVNVPARVRFLSCEPLLGNVSLAADWMPHLHWVIVGGESGPKARPMDLDWARWLRDQCRVAGIPFFLKQLGGTSNPRAHDEAILDGVRHTEMPSTTPDPSELAEKWERTFGTPPSEAVAADPLYMRSALNAMAIFTNGRAPCA